MPVVDGETGEVIDDDTVAYAYTRDGRKEIGKEYPNPVPMEPPIGFVPTEPVHEMMKRMIQRELSELAASKDMETFEDADDFDVDDDFDPESPYEQNFDPQAPWPPQAEVPQEPQPEPQAEGSLTVTNQAGKTVGSVKPTPPTTTSDPAKPLP